ncbi:hypothetical protein RSOLAG1IB_08140 [Rhizoctonia solani AG-1 IB]|uniref:Uncharacterized protein n=2 Tax=Rhizoctonia solani TaxID=456999 RepID=M5CDL4_THACB|nr:unnamed protein product [Rhizoctonia solani]CCO38053.1 hypothetical protein BN14_12216 [Rhizoctonia solani AG-1 IB]CEL56862.1 hypothetical protein RSOLAG1IB_08140 [Rhizoctonia solani AG-1 IB]
MKNVFALLASFMLLAPVVLASPVALLGGKGHEGGKCLIAGQKCGGGLGFCCDHHKCGGGKRGGVNVCVAVTKLISIELGHGGKPDHPGKPEYPGKPEHPGKPNYPGKHD